MGNSASSNLILKDQGIGKESTDHDASQNGAGESQTAGKLQLARRIYTKFCIPVLKNIWRIKRANGADKR